MFLINLKIIHIIATYWRWWAFQKNVSPTFALMQNKITNVEFTTVNPTIANTMLCVRFILKQ
jgi:hypothetical protein